MLARASSGRNGSIADISGRRDTERSVCSWNRRFDFRRCWRLRAHLLPYGGADCDPTISTCTMGVLTATQPAFGKLMDERPITMARWAAGAFCLWVLVAWRLHLSLEITFGLGAGIFVLMMLPEVWWSERAHRSMRRESNLRAAREREYSRARQRERGDWHAGWRNGHLFAWNGCSVSTASERDLGYGLFDFDAQPGC